MKNSKTIIKGTLWLSLAGFFAKLMSSIMRIPLGNLDKQGYSNLDAVYAMFGLITVLSLVGIPQTLSKIVSGKIANNNEEEGYHYYKAALIIQIIIGVLITGFLIIGADFIIYKYKWNEDTKYFIYSFALAPLFIGIAGTIRGYFQANQIMQPTAISQIIENTTKMIIGLSLSFALAGLGYSKSKALCGAAIGISVGYIASCLYLLYKWQKIKPRKKYKLTIEEYKKLAIKIVMSAIPIAIGSSALIFMNSIDSFTLFERLDFIGVDKLNRDLINSSLGVAKNIINFPLVLSTALMVATVPAVSEANERRNHNELNDAMTLTLKFGSLVALPSAIGLITLAQPVVNLLFRGYADAGVYLQYLSVGLVFFIIGQILGNILQGLGYYGIPAWNIIISSIVKLVINYFLIASTFKARGAVIGTVFAYLTFLILNYINLKRKIKFNINVKDIFIKPFISSVVMGIAVWLSYQLLSTLINDKIAVLISIIIGGGIYSILLFKTRCLKEEELSMLPKSDRIIVMLKKVKII